MKRRFFQLQMLIATFAFLISGCSRESLQDITPELTQSLSKTPLVIDAAGPKYIDGAYIVVMKDEVADVDGEVNKIDKQFGFKAKFRYKSALKGFAGNFSAAAVDALRKDPRVAYIEQDQEVYLVATQTNPTWGLDRIDQQSLPLNQSYTYNQTGTGVDAYIIDTGILTSHTDFGGRAVAGYDVITSGGSAIDGNGHGTHVAGTVGGTTYGVAKGTRLIAVRVLDNSGSGSNSGVIAGIDWVTNDHTTRPAVANMSLGGGISTTLDAAVKRSILDGVTYCVAAGNNGLNATNFSPARVTEAITVGATNSADAFASWSNFGSVVDISAPGVSITSAWITSNTATNTISGTSMATPHVTGAAALFLEANPTATPAAVQSALKASGTPNKITGLPTGTVNLLLYSVIGTVSPPTPPAAPALSSPANAATGVAISPTLTWIASTGATSYTVQVSTSSIFTTTVYNVSGITGTSTTVTGLAVNTVYYWRVNATNDGGTSAFSGTWNFTTTATGTVPAAPVLSSPANGSTKVTVPATLSWNASTGAASYTLQVSTSSTFATFAYNVSGITTTSKSVSGLASRTRYYWRVNATNTAGTSAWSVTRNFTTTRF
jgi:subtilisin family serine protease